MQPVVDYLKIDIEGMEDVAVEGMFLDFGMLQNIKQIAMEVSSSFHFLLNITEGYSA